MKKRLLSILCALCVLLTLCPVPASAAVRSSFDDISDAASASAVETLRVMGVLDGFSDGTFRPDETLNRAQFCKMVVLVTGSERELGRYSVVTVFPDVKPSYWAAPYINLAARGQNIIKGYSDGMFHPERTLTLGQAVTILLRLLGYKDEDVGGVWPDGYMAMADSIGLTDGVGSDSSAPLGRGRAAILFSNLLRASDASGKAFASLGAETTLKSFDADAETMVTENGTYAMDTFRSSAGLVGNRGQVVLRDGKALTFLVTPPDKVTTAGSAVFVQSDRSAKGFSALTDERTDYRIRKNGADASVGDLRVGDVAVYIPATNTVSVCDTRLTAYYENCYPSPDAPETVELLNGTTFSVLPTAADMLSNFKPGQLVTFLLTADGQIAGAVDSDSKTLRGNAVFIRGGGSVLIPDIPEYEDDDGKDGDTGNSTSEEKKSDTGDSANDEKKSDTGKSTSKSSTGAASSGSKTVTYGSARLLCGGLEIPVKCGVPVSAGVAARISWDDEKNIRFHALTSAVSGTLDFDARKLGSTSFAENVRVYDGDGVSLDLDAYRTETMPASVVTSSRTNWAGKVDLIVINGKPGDTVYYGRAEINISRNNERVPVADANGNSPDDDDWRPTYERRSESVLNLTVRRDGGALGPFAVSRDNVQTGDFVAVKLNKQGDGFSMIRKLSKIDNVSFAAWAGKTAVSAGGRTYNVPDNVLCYNRDNGRWMSLDDAKVYARRAALYVEDDAVRALEVRT